MMKFIQQEWKPDELLCGKLLQKYIGFWHYAVALSNTKAISWSPCHLPKVYDKGIFEIHDISAEYKEAIYVPYIELSQIYQNLIASVKAFHTDWKYGIQGWNCEHCARLIVSNDTISYQVKQNFFGFFDFFGYFKRNQEAIKHLKKFKQ